MIRLVEVTKTFGTGTSALNDVSLTIEKGEFVFLVGPSGSGKTTLLRLLIRDMLPTKGIITIGDWNLVELPNNKVPHLRKRIGVVFQDLKLLMDRTIYENIMLPLEMSEVDQNEAKQKVEQIVEQVGLSEHLHKFPVQLSGGELQRAAIARALVFSPEILLADEPTGNLDNTTSWEIVKLLNDINKAGTTVIMATHNLEVVSSLGKRTVTLEKGRVIKDAGKSIKQEDQEDKGKKEVHEKKDNKEIKDSKKGEKYADN